MRSFKQMDLDAYSAAHREEWDRLARLAAKRRFSGVEADELIDHYQSGASQLSVIRTTVGESAQGDRLSLSLSRARLRFTGASANVLSQIPKFFAAQLPAALYSIRWLTLAVALATFVVAFIYAWWAISNPAVLAGLLTPEERRQFAEEDFIAYYSNYSGSSFTAQVWTNNAWVAAQAIGLGILGVFTPAVLLSNAQNLGLSAAIMSEFGHLDQFFLYIAPHGQLELYSIFVAGAAGLRIFWAWIAPGTRTRAQSLAHTGRALFTIVIGLALALLVSGVIEGFVTRQDWPWVIKIGIGTIALSAFLVYQWVVGGRA
ncbi:MAG TPA: stage II sporulation protein M, partial [Rhodoglobus sp.]|nr:stage II sporulation protein M [Rhodoglobus sp.]